MASNNPEVVISQNRSFSQLKVFPSDLGGSIDNRIVITIHEYTRGNPMTSGNLSPALATIVLPIPEGLRDSSNLRYTEEAMGFVGGTLGNFGAGKSSISEIAAMGGSALGRTGDKILSALAGAVDVVTGGGGRDVAKAIQMGANYASNPNLAMSFDGVSLRNHNLSWRLVARSAAESKTIEDIINIMKKAVLPRKYVGANYQFAYPYVFKLEFNPKDLLKVSKLGCFVQDMDVSYESSGVAAFYAGTDDPVTVNLSMKFVERAVLTAEDYGAESVALLKGSTGKL